MATVDTSTIDSPRWQAVGLVLDQNTRDVLARRYGPLQEVVSWFKGIDLFRQAEVERMIQRKPTATDKRYHKTWLVALIAEGERLLTEVRANGGLPRNKSGIKLSDVEATLEELYDTQAEWHGSMKPVRRAKLLKELFDAAYSRAGGRSSSPLRVGNLRAKSENRASRKTGRAD